MLRKVFIIAFLLLSCIMLSAQEPGGAQSREEQLYWETVLDAYEDFAKTYEELHGKRRSADILRKKQQNIDQLLLHPKGKMSEEQRRRFNGISLKAGLPIVLPAEQEPEPERKPEVSPVQETSTVPAKRPSLPAKREEQHPAAKTETPGQEIKDTVAKQTPLPAIAPIALLPKAISESAYKEVLYPDQAALPTQPRQTIPWNGYLLLQTGFSPEWMVGLMAGVRSPIGVGLYACWRIHPSASDLKNAYVADNVSTFWANGNAAFRQQIACAGILAGKGRYSAYVGAGYGNRTCFWQDVDGEWARIPSASLSGLAIEAGGLISAGKFCFSLGASTLRLKTLGVTAGFGLYF